MLFQEIVGQQSVKNYLLQTVKENRISHAQLFLGPPGSGNLPLALAYAQYILCNKKNENDACGQCPSCIKMGKLVHPDFHLVFPVFKRDSKDKEVVSDDFIAPMREAIIANPYLSLDEFLENEGIENEHHNNDKNINKGHHDRNDEGKHAGRENESKSSNHVDRNNIND